MFKVTLKAKKKKQPINVFQSDENKQRGLYAVDCLENYKGDPEGEIHADPETVIADFLADLRHLCDKLDLDFAALDKRGYGYYSEDAQSNRPEPLSVKFIKEK